MADRTVKVALIASVQQYREGMRQAAKATTDFGKEVTSGSKASTDFLDNIGPKAVVAGGALAAGLGFAVSKAMDFEQAMSNLGAVAGATGDQMDQLRQQAIDAGAATVFSASDAAVAQTELAKAGVAVQDIMGGGLRGALDLAAAGNLDLGRAAEIAAAAMTTFKLEGGDVGRIADALAAGANKSAADVDDMAQAMQQSSLVAAQFDIDLETAVGTLAMFAQNGLRGSDAGTSFKTMLQRLVPQSEEAARKMEELGIDFFDAQGKFVGLDQAAQELQDALGNLSEEQRTAALTTLFGSDAIRAATIFYEGGAEGVNEWTTAVSESGYAAELAEEKMDNLAGDLEALKGSFETALIEGGSKATDALRGLTQGATDLVNGFGAMPGALQGATVGVGAVTSAGLLGIGAFGMLYPKIVETKKALEGMGAAGQFASRNIGRVAGGLAVAGVALTVYSYFLGKNAARQAEAEEAARAYTDAILDQGAAVGAQTDALAANAILEGDLGKALRDATADMDVFLDELRGGSDDVGRLNKAWDEFPLALQLTTEPLDRLTASLDDAGLAGSALGDELVRLATEGDLSTDQINDLVNRLAVQNDVYRSGAREAENKAAADKAAGVEAEGAVPGVDALTDAVVDETTALEEAEKALDAYLDRMRGAIDPLFGMIDAIQGVADAQRGFNDAIEGVGDAKEAIADAEDALATARKEFGLYSDEAEAALDTLEKAQDDYEQSLRDVETAERDAVESALDLNVAAAELAGGIANGTVTLEDAVIQLAAWKDQGLITQEQAEHLAAQFGAAADQADRLQGERVLRVRAELDPVLAALFSGANMADRGLIPVALSGTRAAGGPVGPGTWLVGERGPELLTLGSSGAGMVTPLNWTGAGSVSSTSTTNAPTIVNNIGSSQLDSMTLARIERAGRRAAEQVQYALGARL